jgi:putative flippase GtrA
MEVVALIPAFRPGKSLVDVADGLRALGFDRIYVVDDGSGPEYAECFQQVARRGAVVLRHAVNLGKGAALKTGLNVICADESGMAGVVTVDADGQHLPKDVATVVSAFLQDPGALVLGARRFGDAPLRSRLGNELTRVLFRAMHDVSLEDTQTGLRAFNLDFARKILDIQSRRYEFELDVLVFACKSAKRIKSVDIETVYIDGNKSSHFNPILDSVKIYFSLFRFSLAGFAAAVLDNGIFAFLYAAGCPIFLSQVVGRAVASVANYALLKRLVFHSDEANRVAVPKFVAAVVLFGLASYGLIIVCQDRLGLPVVPTKILIETLIFFTNYTFQRVMVFKERER